MTAGRCQLCGRHKGARRDGGLVLHYVAGVPCLGTGAPPIELDDAHLAASADQAATAWRAAWGALRDKRRELAGMVDRRANYIPPELEASIAHLDKRERELDRLSDRLGRRLRRHRDWPARFAREMERHGYGSPPPQYLRDRELERI